MISPDFNNTKLHVDNNPDNLDEATLLKVNALREERNLYNKKATELQNKIDDIVLQYNNYADLNGKYLKIAFNDENTIYCGPIYKVDRIYNRSCRIYAKNFIRILKSDLDEFYKIVLTINDMITISKYSIDQNNNRRTNYEEISESDFNNILENEITTFKQNL